MLDRRVLHAGDRLIHLLALLVLAHDAPYHGYLIAVEVHDLVDLDAADRIHDIDHRLKSHRDKVRDIEIEVHVEHADRLLCTALRVGGVRLAVLVIRHIEPCVTVHGHQTHFLGVQVDGGDHDDVGPGIFVKLLFPRIHAEQRNVPVALHDGLALLDLVAHRFIDMHIPRLDLNILDLLRLFCRPQRRHQDQQQEDLRDKQQNLSPFLLCRLLRRFFRVLRVLRCIALLSPLCLYPLRRAARCRSPGLACGICLPWLSVRPCLRCGCLSPGLAALPYLAVRRSPGLS